VLSFPVILASQSRTKRLHSSLYTLRVEKHFPAGLELALVPLQTTLACRYRPNTAIHLNLLESTSAELSASVDSKWLTKSINSLESILTKNRGGGGLLLTRIQSPMDF
jgi:hypothetical protein